MTRPPHANREGRSVVPLSLALLVFNVLGGGEPAPSPRSEPSTEASSSRAEPPEDPTGGRSTAPGRVC